MRNLCISSEHVEYGASATPLLGASTVLINPLKGLARLQGMRRVCCQLLSRTKCRGGALTGRCTLCTGTPPMTNRRFLRWAALAWARYSPPAAVARTLLQSSLQATESRCSPRYPAPMNSRPSPLESLLAGARLCQPCRRDAQG